MSVLHAWIFIVTFGVIGLYIVAAPRRLFMRSDEPAAYRPETVEYDSEQGRWLRKVLGPAFIVVALVLIVVRII